MRLVPIHPIDKILSEDIYTVPIDNPSLPPAVSDGVVMVRGQGDNLALDLNQYVIRDIHRIWSNESLTNRRRRIYALLGTREPSIVGEWLDSLPSVQIREPTTYSSVWEHIVRIGNYKEQYKDASLTLDYLVYKDILEYEIDGRYSLSTKWVRNTFQRYSTIPYYRARTDLHTDDKMLTRGLMEQFGFEDNPDMEQFERVIGNSRPAFFTG